MKKILHLVLSLTVISAVCAAILAVVNEVTKEPIRNIAALKANQAARVVLPRGVRAIETRADPADKSVTIFLGYSDDAKKHLVGYAVLGLSASGYGGDIRLMVGLTADRRVVSYQILAANETPGLGAKLGTREFSAQFAGRPAADLKVRKDGGTIDAITGATITSRAVCGAIADANARLDRLAGKAPATPSAAPAVHEGRMLVDPTRPATALKVLPKTTTAVTPHRGTGPFPIFEGRDAANRTTGYAVTGSGTGKGPEGTIRLYTLYAFTPSRTLNRAVRPLPVNQPSISAVDMIKAQMDALNAAMKDAEAQLRSLAK